MFRRAQESRTQSKAPIPGWKVIEHDDWRDMQNVDIPVHGGDGSRNTDAAVTRNVRTDDLRTAAETFKKAHPDMQGSYDDPSKTLKVYIEIHLLL